MSIPTPHIEAAKEDLAKVVLMPGDPLRAKYIAETFLENPKQINVVRNMLGYTGTYQGKEVTVFGSGMGMPSIGIYSYELYAFYDVEAIVRIGSCGSYDEEVKVYDVLLAKDAWSESSYAKVQSGIEEAVIESTQELNETLLEASAKLNIPMKEVRIHSSDVFYREKHEDFKEIHEKKDCKAVEMEAFALFANAKVLGKKAACLLTVSDSLVTGEATTSEERQKSFTNMMKVALEAAITI